jgi:tetratricopeptide (TPR) repeat protein
MFLSSQLYKFGGLEDEETRQALQLFEQNDFAEAEKLMQQVVDEREQTLGKEHKRTLLSKYTLVTVLHGRSNYQQAEMIAREAVHEAEGHLGRDDRVTLQMKTILGEALLYQERYRGAEKLLRQVVDGWERKSMPNTEEELETKEDLETEEELETEARVLLGTAVYHQDKYSEAEEILRRLVVVGGELSPFTLKAKMVLGGVFFCRNRFNEAKEVLRQALDGWRKIARHGDRIKVQMHWTEHWLASVSYRQEKYKDAERLFRAARDGFMLLNGYEEESIRTSYWLSKTMYQRKKYSEAEELLRQTIVESEKVLDQDQTLAWEMNELEEKLKQKLSPSSSDVAKTFSQAAASRLESFFQKKKETREPYTSSEIIEIASVLSFSSPRWSKVPRTYIVLRTIGHLNLLDDIINTGFSDFWFPVTKQRLPECLSTSARRAFFETQHIILTKSMDLEKGQTGQHCYFDESDTLPLQEQGILGTGGFGQVDKVTSLISFKTYARKRVRRSLAFRSRKDHMQLFIDEIQLLKRLKHRHVVEFVGSYTDTTYIGLIMSPVAKMDLDRYLTDCTVARHPELRTFFGCLATALEFLHGENVRHKDIKPGNILVESSGNILFADFGLSLDFTDANGSTITGMVQNLTPRYCAPEVADREKRNTKSDIWSLGIVFMEMIVVLKGKTPQDVDDFFEQHGSERIYIHANIDALPEFIAALEGMGQLSDNIAFSWVKQMLRKEQRLRPTASSLVTSILASTGFCGICCVDSEGDFLTG